MAAVIAFLFAWNEYTYALVLVNGTSRSVFQFLPSAAFFSASVSSSHQPSFFISTWSNSG